MRLSSRISATAISLLVCAFPAVAQQLSDFVAPQPVPTGSTLVVGFLGGFDRWDDPHRSVRKVVLHLRSRGLYAETAGNHSYRTALKFIRLALDTNHDGRIDPSEASAARIILFGQSWGGSAAVRAARALQAQGVPVLLTVQVDSVGLHDAVIPPNVRAAANFYQHDHLTIRGQREIHPADPYRTRILGNFQFSYGFRSVDESDASWMRRTIGRSHSKMELDPLVWTKVERLILDAVAK
jgi:pimeloyl-ACP methyl ester carboxylesterase